MRSTKKVTLSAMATALSAVFLTVGALWEVMDFSLCAFASLLVVFVYIEIGSPYTWLVWLCTSLISFISFSGSAVWVEYFAVFGIYPILKAYIERTPRALWWILKLVYINAVTVAAIFCIEFLIGNSFFGTDVPMLKVLTYVLVNVAFVAYDLFLTVLIRLYMTKYRHRFRKFLK